MLKVPKAPKTTRSFDKFELYENSVQTPKTHVEWFTSIFQEIHGYPAHDLREDFCGTFRLSCAWVEKNIKNTALGIDLDPEPLAYGKKRNWANLSPSQKKRLKTSKSNVLVASASRVDLIIGCNFSFFIFKTRKLLLEYFKSCIKSLRPKGALLLEIAGGPGMIAPTREQKTVTLENGKKYVYIWEQKSFDPITHDAQYAIHFKTPRGDSLKNVFTYDWRLWTIPEVKDVLHEAGFKKTFVYWETAFQGKGTGEFVQTEKGDNAYAWIAYLVATP